MATRNGRTRLTLISMLACMAGFNDARASHAMAMDINYEHIAGETYRITLNFYRDCSGTTAPNPVYLNISSVLCGVNQTLTLTLDTFYEVSQLCPTELPNSECNPLGTLPGTQKYVYSALYTFPAKCSDWILSYSLCCRNGAITNLMSPSSWNQYVYTTLNNTGTINNNSPLFATMPTPYVCANQPMVFNPGAADPDGDSLVFALAQPMDAAGVYIPYNSPYTANYPLSTSTGTVTFNPATGELSCTPNIQQVAVISMKVYEFRNGVLLDSLQRDYQVIVISCDNQQPVISNITNVSGAGATQLDSVSIQVCGGSSMCFTFSATDPNSNQALIVTSNNATALPGSTFSTTGSNPVTVTVCWTAPPDSVSSTHFLTVKAEDDTCPINAAVYKTFRIVIFPGTYAGPDVYVCGDSVQLMASGGTSFSWAPPTGLSCTNCPNPKALPSATTTYTVTSNLVSVCDSTDEVTVFVVPPFAMDAGPPDTICRGEALFLSPSYQSGSYTFLWAPSSSLSNPNIPAPLAYPAVTTVYTLTMFNTVTQCSKDDTVRIVVTGAAPAVFPFADDDSLCLGQNAQLDVLLGCGGDCSNSSGNCNGPITGTVGNESNVLTYSQYPAVFGKWQNKSHNQILYRASEILASGVPAGGKISSIAFNVSAVFGTPQYQQFTVKMKCTTLERFETNVPDYTGLKTVYTPKTFTGGTGWVSIPFDSLFAWDGQSNIIIDICFNNSSFLGFNDPTYYTPTSYNSMIYTYWYACGTPNPRFFSNKRPNTRFTVCCDTTGFSGFTYSWIPTTGLSNPNVKNPVATPTTTTTYTVFASDTGSECSTFGEITILVTPDFTLSTIPDTTICRGGEVQLYSNPSIGGTGFSYLWSPPYQLSSTTISNPVAQPFVDTTYYVNVDHYGCDKYDSVHFTVVPSMGLVEVLPVDTTICRDATVQLIAKASPPPASCDTTTVSCGSGPHVVGMVHEGYDMSIGACPFQQASDHRIQYLYRAEDLWRSGIYGGTITELAVYVPIGGNAAPYTNFSVSLGCTALKEFPSPPAWVTGLKQVYTNAAYTCAGGWNVFPLATPYNWDGESSLIIEMCYDGFASYSTWSTVFFDSTSYYSVLYKTGSFTAAGCALTSPNRDVERPLMRVTACSPPGTYSYSWAPPTWLSNPSISNPVATPIASTTYTVTISSGACDFTGRAVHIDVDSFGLSAGPDTTICPATADSIQMWSSIGYVPMMKLDCGYNNTPCGATPDYYQFGTGTETTQTWVSPFQGMNGLGNQPYFGRAQYIITADELRAEGRLYDGVVTQVEVECSFTSGTAYDGMQIKMGCTTMDQFPSNAFVPGLQTVKLVPNGFVPVQGWNVFVLDSIFDWDGVSNVIIEFCYTTGNTATEPTVNTYTGPRFMTVATVDIASMCGLSVGGGHFQYRPNLSLGICNPPTSPVTYSWSPGNTLNDSTIANPKAAPPTDTITYVLTASAGECIVQEQVTFNVCEQLLPITWLTFDAWPVADQAHLEWSVQADNTSRFIVERREPGGTFRKIGEVRATQHRSRYEFTDIEPFKPTNYYRIRHVDHSGGYDYSVIRMVEFFGQELSATLMPNPLSADRDLTLSISGLTRETEVNVEVLNAVGAVVTRRHMTLSPGHSSMVLEGTLFTAGAVYLVNAEVGGQVMHLKLVRQ